MVYDIILSDADYPETFESLIECSLLRKETDELKLQAEKEALAKAYRERLMQSLSRITGLGLDELSNVVVAQEYILQAMDETFGTLGALIKPSHAHLKYSLMKQDAELEKYVPDQTDNFSKILSSVWVRGQEILREYSSENTFKAFKGDLVYWQAWLSAIGYSFYEEPINIGHVQAFIIQHIEGLPFEIDQQLVEQGYKQAIGPHKMATVKRRVASLSIHLQRMKLPNPCHDLEVKKLLEKLTKKYGDKKRKARAITKDVLNAILETCDDTLIGLRDKALLLFAWASGGRRRSEISEAEIKNLEVGSNGNFLYHMPKSKTDQKGEGTTIPINGRAANALKEWFWRSGIKEGKIFRSVAKGGSRIGEKITDVDINRMVKRRCEKAGYDPNLYSAHSLRSGFITEAGRQGCALGDAMALSGHKSVNTAMGYYQIGNLASSKAANLME